MKGVADTSWLIAHINADDRFHAKARRESQTAELVHIPGAIWVEFLNVLQYRFGGHAVAAKASDQVRRSGNVTIGDRLDDESIQGVWRRHANLTYADSAAVSEAKRLGIALLTLDEEQRQALEAERQS